MGAGRKTFTYDCDSVGSYSAQYESRQRNLGKDLGGVIFMATHQTLRECQTGLIFGLPAASWCFVQHVRAGMPIFLYNVSDKKLHGIYRASCDGAWEINPHGWTPDGAGKTKYPAQVAVEVHADCPTLSQAQFHRVIAANLFVERGQEKFRQELDKQQAADLCAMFHRERERERGGKAPVAAVAAPSNGRSSRDAGAAAAQRPSSSGQPATAPPAVNSNWARQAMAAAAKRSSAEEMEIDSPSAARQTPPPQVKAISPTPTPATATATATATAPHGIASSSGGHSMPAVRPGVDILSDELTALKGTMAPIIAAMRSSRSDSATADALSAHLARLDDALMACQKDRSKLLKVVAEKEVQLQALRSKGGGGGGGAAAAAQRPASGGSGAAAPGPVPQTVRYACEEVLIVGGMSLSQQYSAACDLLSPQTMTWRPGPDMPAKRAYCGTAAIGSDVFVVGGGGQGEQWLDSALRLDLSAGIWSPIAPLAAPRGSMACVALSGKVWAVGGGQGGKFTATTELFDRIVGIWTAGPSLTMPRFTTAGATLDGAIYCVGGFEGTVYARSAERIDPREGKWMPIADMSCPRGAHAVVAAHGSLYALGGYDGSTEGPPGQPPGFLRSVERFDPRAGRWETVAPMAAARAYGAAFVLEDKLYVLGGTEGGNVYSELFEMYDVENNEWVATGAGLPRGRSMMGAVVVNSM